MNIERNIGDIATFAVRYAHTIGFATAAHIGQVRKYTGEPYVEHTIAVAVAVAEAGGTAPMVHAAILHDVLEDTDISYKELLFVFGPEVANLVNELTDLYTTQRYPDWNRAIRKGLEAERLGKASDEAKAIKRADIANNWGSILEHDPKFAKVYLKEKEAMLKAMG